jgi:hypothetical protein
VDLLKLREPYCMDEKKEQHVHEGFWLKKLKKQLGRPKRSWKENK